VEAGVPTTWDDAAELHKLIAEVGERTRSPLPDKVVISPYPDCHVSEHRQFALGTQRNLNLVLGLPHLAVFAAGELQIVIAHELAHFRGGDTRLGVFLHRFLESLREATEPRQNAVTRWVDPVYWLRRIYFAVSFALAAPIWKFQELRADSVSAKAFGGEATARTLLREWMLAQQFEVTFSDYALNRSADGHPKAILDPNPYREFTRRFLSLTSQAEMYARRRLEEEERSSLFDSHPTMRARIETVLMYPSRESLNPRPARDLLPNFESLQERFGAELAAGLISAGGKAAADSLA
jgi:Zn-dependent protease with chaperone function